VNGSPNWIAVGRIARAHGVKGEVAVQPLSQVGSRFDPGSRLYAAESEDRPLVVLSSRPHHARLLVVFEGIDDRAAADALRGTYLFVPASSAPPLAEGEYWPHQLVGCQVVTEQGRSLGRIKEVIRTTANDVWATDGGTGEDEVLIPALKEVVLKVDVEGRTIVVRDVPGLTAP
jgi:16S rRNA processing protein RimM